MKKAQRAAQEYEEMFDTTELYNVADLIVENKMLIDKVDQMIGKDMSTTMGRTRAEEDDEESNEMSQSMIDELY